MTLCFDHSLSVPALPEHLTSGLLKYVMRACFDALKDDVQRRSFDIVIVNNARGHGLDVKANNLAWKKTRNGPKYVVTVSNSMSAWFSILAIASPVFEDHYSESILPVDPLPKRLQ